MELSQIIACPECKCRLDVISHNGNVVSFHCGICANEYFGEAGIPNLLPPHFKDAAPGISKEMSEEAVKGYYIKTERYDWVVDTKYPEKLFHILRERAIIKNLKKYARGKVGLDLGCGTGLITRHIALEYTVGMDLNPWAIAKAGSHVTDRVQFVVGDAENLPLMADTFDVVVCTDVLEHLLNPEKAVLDIFRLLKSGGMLLGTVPNKNLVWNYRKAISTTCPVCEPFHNNFSNSEVKTLLHGFDIIHISREALGLEWLFVVRKTKPGK